MSIMSILIRRAVPADRVRIRPLQEQIASLHKAGRPDLFRAEARFFTQDAFNERLRDPNHTVLIAEKDGEVVGYAFAWVIFYRDHSTYMDHDTFYIDDICVLESCRRQGIGRKLFEQCREFARAQGCINIDLGVWGFNREAIAFYESCGMHERVRRMELCLEGEA